MEHAYVIAMNMSILELVRKVNLNSYIVHLNFQAIHVVVTHNPDIVRFWISMVTFAIRHEIPHYLVIGVWVEWRRSERMLEQRNTYQKPDILQLFIGEHCLIYQIGHANGNIPQELVEFLGDNNFTFVGLEIEKIVEILNSEYNIRFGQKVVDLNSLYKRTRRVENNNGLRGLMNSVLGMDYVRPKAIHMSRWDDLVLNQHQILFACASAYTCFWVGIYLHAWDFRNVSGN